MTADTPFHPFLGRKKKNSIKLNSVKRQWWEGFKFKLHKEVGEEREEGNLLPIWNQFNVMNQIESTLFDSNDFINEIQRERERVDDPINGMRHWNSIRSGWCSGRRLHRALGPFFVILSGFFDILLTIDWMCHINDGAMLIVTDHFWNATGITVMKLFVIWRGFILWLWFFFFFFHFYFVLFFLLLLVWRWLMKPFGKYAR